MRHRVADYGSTERIEASSDPELSNTNKAVEDAIAAAEHAAHPGAGTPRTAGDRRERPTPSADDDRPAAAPPPTA